MADARRSDFGGKSANVTGLFRAGCGAMVQHHFAVGAEHCGSLITGAGARLSSSFVLRVQGHLAAFAAEKSQNEQCPMCSIIVDCEPVAGTFARRISRKTGRIFVILAMSGIFAWVSTTIMSLRDCRRVMSIMSHGSC